MVILLIAASQEARIRGMGHDTQALQFDFHVGCE
jgi:hypothetical protein